MLHLLTKPAAPDVGPVPIAVGSTQQAATPVLSSEQDVVFRTAAAVLVTPATTHRHWPGATLFAAVHRIHIALPEPRPIYPRREAGYFEAARMSRQLDHL